MKIVIPFKTPTINHLYGFRGFHKFMTKEAKELKEKIKEVISQSSNHLSDEGKYWGKGLFVSVEIHENWLTKKGLVARKDIANREKFLIDSVFEALGIDDKFIFEHNMRKIQSNEEQAIITIEVLNE